MSKAVRTRKILDVNDDLALHDIVQFVLEREGYEVIAANDGREGIETALREKPDLILMNYMMPLMDGDAATERLREHTEMRDVPIILNTGCADPKLIDRLMLCGFTDYFILPCSASEIIEIVRKYCPLVG